MAKRKGSKDQLSQQRDAIFHLEFCEDLRHWVQTDRKLALCNLQLVEAIMRDPFRGIGKPEGLKHVLSGALSRQLMQEHRIVYVVKNDRVEFLQARYYF